MSVYSFDGTNEKNCDLVAKSLKLVLKSSSPVIVCIGSDLVIGDSLGPLIGSNLIKINPNAYVYGNLNSPITAKEIVTLNNVLKTLHLNEEVLVIDASVGNKEDVGKVRISDKGIKPGLGVKKDLPLIGNASITAIIGDKENAPNCVISGTRLSFIYSLSTTIVKGIEKFFNN